MHARAVRGPSIGRRLEEIGFVAPIGWKECSIVSFVAPRPIGGGMAANVVIVREPLAANETLLAFAHRYLADVDVPPCEAGFVALHGVTAYRVVCAEGEVEWSITFIETGSEGERFVIHVTMTHARGDLPAQETLAGVLSSVRVVPPRHLY
jgi:hypothetical protein